ncbi:hypothetical protein RCL1_008688 [Eukaryota sp. TZLM3-RCL]
MLLSHMLVFPSSCLSHVFLLSLSRYSLLSNNVKLNPLSKIFQHLSFYGNVSTNFRSLVVNAVNILLHQNHIVFELPKHSSQIFSLHNHANSCSFAIKLDPTYSNVSLANLSINSVHLLGSDAVPDESILTFLNANDYSLVRYFHLTCHQPFSFLLSNSIVSSFSLLQSLSVEIFSCNLSLFQLSDVFSLLESLRIVNQSLSINKLLIDVSKNINLTNLSIIGSSSLIGLDQLAKLQVLELKSVKLLDNLHKDCRLERASLTVIGLECFQLLVSSQEQYISSKIFIKDDFQIPESHWWMFKSNLVQWILTSEPSDFLLYIPPVNSLEHLKLNSESNWTISLDNFPRLETLHINFFLSRQSFLFVSRVIYLKSLTLTHFSYKTLFQIIKFTPFLQHLAILFAKDKIDLQKMPQYSLSHLVYLEVQNSREFFTVISLLPKVVTLIVADSSDFDCLNLLPKFPNLSSLKVTDCKIDSTHMNPNSTISFLSINFFYHKCSLLDISFLSKFKTLQHLSLDLSTFVLDLAIHLPSGVKSFHCKLHHTILSKLQPIPHSLVAVGGIVYAEDRDIETVKYSLENFKKNNPRLCCSLIVKTTELCFMSENEFDFY